MVSSAADSGPGPSSLASSAACLPASTANGDLKKDAARPFPRRATSPMDFPRRLSNTAPVSAQYTTALATTIAGGKVPAGRPRDKFVPLPDENKQPQIVAEEKPHELEDAHGALVPGPAPRAERGRITVICVAESFNRIQLEATLLKSHSECSYQAYPEVMYVRTPYGERDGAPGEVFFFDYGVVAFWGLTEMQEQQLLLSVVAGAAVEPLDQSEKQVDELLFVHTDTASPHIQNDTITINRRQSADPQVKMSISHALAQSSKLSIYEERMVELVEEVRHIPRQMAERGTVNMSRRQIAKLMGKVFLLKASIHLMSTVLDVPEYFWRAPDSQQALYERVCEYLELGERLSLLDARFVVLQKMLSIWTDHSAHHYLSRLDTIIVLLILLEVVLGAAEVVGFVFKHYH